MTQEGAPALPFETALEKLQATVKRMEGGELSLEQSLKHFEEGVMLTRVCQEQLSAAEKRVEVLIKSNSDGSVGLQPFNSNKS